MLDKELLNADALADIRVAISASESEDLARLGLVETHFRLAIGEIARSVTVGGGMLGYGGHLDPEGYTAFLVHELHRYSRRDRPLRIYLAWPEHRRVPLSTLKKEKEELGLYGDIVYLDPEGRVIPPELERGEEPQPETDTTTISKSLTAMRKFMANDTQARVLIGGKRSGFQGALPGVVEEALISTKLGQPLYLVAGFGGATFDIARALDIDNGDWLPSLSNSRQDERLGAGLSKLHAIINSKDHTFSDNGLSKEESLRLARTPRPSDVASLISLGLGRRFSKE